MIPFSFHPDAEIEFMEAIDYYESCSNGLGKDFAREVWQVIQLVREYPNAWPVLKGNVRRCQVSRFPYAILYSLQQNGIYILAVMHLHRRPGYWKGRG